ncbi:unannotated protein [freshwater metagenome]|uniref:Unannotated protein n=1 Tax=freshwater metagenome TaxID=449393 RepID=A0A6J7EB01_9ZZZZ|nr:L,D-transpeptidase family protein [Actinomycetota bacterium]
MRRLLPPIALLLTLAAAAGPASAARRPVKLYFTAGEQLRIVDRRLSENSTTLLPALRALLSGPTSAERARGADTQIPRGVKLRSVTVTAGGGATVVFTQGFLKDIPVDAAQRTSRQTAALRARLAQVIFTVTQFGDIDEARVVAGEVTIDEDVSREDYATPSRPPKPQVIPPGEAIPGTRAVQERLTALGYLPASAVDGLAGYRTQQAIMAFQAWNGLDRDGVVGPATSAKLKTASRPRGTAGGASRRIEVHRARGVALLIDGGRVVRAIHISTGAGADATPRGRYRVFRKERRSWSVPFRVWLPYASYFNKGIALHESPDVPPQPASHGCVRVPAPEAPEVYAFATVGTEVVVVG